MRCKEVIRRLNEGSVVDGEMQQHLANCPSCAKEAEAAGMLKSAFSAEARTDHTTTPISHVQARVMAEFGKERTLMSTIADRIKNRPRIVTGTAVAFAFLIIATLVPFTYEKTVGYEATFAGIAPEEALPPSGIVEAAVSLGYDGVNVNMRDYGSNVQYTVSGLPTSEAAREIKAMLSLLVGSDCKLTLKPVKQKVSGTLYAQVRDKLVEIKVDATGKSDAEIEAEIESRLAEAGATNSEVNVSTSADGERSIDVSLDADGESTWKIEVGDGTSDPMCQGLDFSIDGMTDAEAKAYLEQQLRAKGVENPDVTVMTGPDGQRKIMVGCK
jgi:hypothetical protein